MGKYLFADTDLAALRLEKLAAAYEPDSRKFIRDKVQTAPQLALDLGCGPGCTTRLLAQETKGARVVGLDKSVAFVERAQRDAPAGVAFLTHDLTQTPFPLGPADLLYCRLVLAHQRDPFGLVETWGTQLQAGGLLLIEEMDYARSDRSLFSDYLDIVVAMLADEGYDMYAGPHLQAGDSALLRTVSSEEGEVVMATHVVAELFHMNIQTWKKLPFIRANYDAARIEAMERELAELKELDQDEGQHVWGMRRMVLERRAD